MRYTQWEVLLASDAVEAEIDALPDDMQARYLRMVDLLEQKGPQALGMPYVRPLENKLWEMRIKGRDGIARAIYIAMTGRRLIVLHAFVKKTQKTPRRAIVTAKRRLEALTL